MKMLFTLPGVCLWSKHGLLTFPQEMKSILEGIREETSA
jgi:hypothetical protein